MEEVFFYSDSDSNFDRHQVIFNLTVNCKPEDESDLRMVAATVNRLLRITVKVGPEILDKKCQCLANQPSSSVLQDTKARTTLVL